MDVQEEIDKIFKQVIKLQGSGKPDYSIVNILKEQGVPKEVSSKIIKTINDERDKAYFRAKDNAIKNAVKIQGSCLVACPLSAWGFIELKSLPGNLVPLNIGSINIIDSVILTILGSIALTTFFTFFAMFKAYSDS